MRRTRGSILQAAPPIAQWPRPLPEDIREKDLDEYNRSCAAVMLWADQQPEKALRKLTNLTARQTRTLVERCVALNAATNRIFGFWACLPGARSMRQARRRAQQLPSEAAGGAGLGGALELTLAKYPDIERALRKYIEKRLVADGVPVPVVSADGLFRLFLAQARKAGLGERKEWPFNTRKKGREAIRRWYQKQKAADPVRSVNNQYGKTEGYRMKVSYQLATRAGPRHARLYYERVELDERRADGMFTAAIVGRDGVVRQGPALRPIPMALLETRSNAVLANRVVFGGHKSCDVLMLVRQAIVPPPRYAVPFENDEFRYLEAAAFPAELPGLEALGWQVLAWDNHASHISEETSAAIEKAIGCDVAEEMPEDPVRRPYIEGFFRKLAEFEKRLPAATGNSPVSGVRRDPERAAQRLGLVATFAEVLFDMECRNHNATPSDACDGITPLQALKAAAMSGELYHAPLKELRPDTLWALLPVHHACLNRVPVKRERLGPFYVQLYGARYTSPELANHPRLRGLTDLRVRVYVEEDARYAHVVPVQMPDMRLTVAIRGRYGEVPHTLEWRRLTELFKSEARHTSRAISPDLMVGTAEGLSELKGHTSAALLARVTSFMQRFESGATPPVGATARELEALSRAVQRMAFDDEAANEEEGEAIGRSALTRPRRTPPLSDDAGGVIF